MSYCAICRRKSFNPLVYLPAQFFKKVILVDCLECTDAEKEHLAKKMKKGSRGVCFCTSHAPNYQPKLQQVMQSGRLNYVPDNDISMFFESENRKEEIAEAASSSGDSPALRGCGKSEGCSDDCMSQEYIDLIKECEEKGMSKEEIIELAVQRERSSWQGEMKEYQKTKNAALQPNRNENRKFRNRISQAEAQISEIKMQLWTLGKLPIEEPEVTSSLYPPSVRSTEEVDANATTVRRGINVLTGEIKLEAVDADESGLDSAPMTSTNSQLSELVASQVKIKEEIEEIEELG